jgi:hypothetical protein
VFLDNPRNHYGKNSEKKIIIMTGALLNAGTHTLYVKFKPSDTTDYNSAAASVSINVVPLQKIQKNM